MTAPVLGTPTSGTLTNCTFPTLNQNTTGTAGGITASNSNVPSCLAIPSGTTTLAANGFTKIALLGTPTFDIGSFFDHTTNSRYTPTKAGIYHFDGVMYLSTSVSATIYSVVVYLNGSLYQVGNLSTDASTTIILTVSGLVTLNGSTDYIELWGYNGHATLSATVASTANRTSLHMHYVGPTS